MKHDKFKHKDMTLPETECIFDVSFSCNLTKNLYTIFHSRGAASNSIRSAGIYDDIFGFLTEAVTESSYDLMRDFFSRESLIEFFEQDNSFRHMFFSYNMGDKYIGDAFIVAYKIAEKSSSDVNCLIFLKNVGNLYGEAFSNHKNERIENDSRYLDRLRLAACFNTERDEYVLFSGNIVIDNQGLEKKGNFNDLLSGICRLFVSNADKKSFLLSCEIRTLLETFRVYGSHYINRFLLEIDGRQRWHEFIFLYLDEENGKILLLINDIHAKMEKEAYEAIMADDGENGKTELIDETSLLSYNNVGEAFCEIELRPGLPIRHANALFYSTIGYSPEEFRIKDNNMVLFLCHPADVPFVVYNYELSLRKEREIDNLEIRIIRSDGEVRWLSISITHKRQLDAVIGYLTARDITEEKIVSNISLLEQQEMEKELSNQNNAFFDYDFKSHTLVDRTGLQKLFGLPREIQNFDKWLENNDIVYPEHHEVVNNMMQRIIDGEASVFGNIMIRVPSEDNHYMWFRVTLSVIYEAHRTPLRAMGVLENINETRRMTHSMTSKIGYENYNTSDAIVQFILNLSKDMVEMYEPLHYKDLEQLNPVNKSADMAVKKVAELYVRESKRRDFVKDLSTKNLLEQYYLGNKDITIVVPIVHERLGEIWLKCMVHLIQDELNSDIMAYIYAVDVSEEYKTISSLEEQSFRDPLTNLYNRKYAETKITEILNNSESIVGLISAFAIIDLDNFKAVNDTYGHQNGDAYLVELSDMLKSWSTEKDIVFRLGGDEFAVFLEDYDSQEIIDGRLNELAQALKITSRNHVPPLPNSGSIGVALCPEHGTSFDELYKCADSALYYAKNNSKGEVSYYDFFKILKKSPKEALVGFLREKHYSIATLLVSTIVAVLMMSLCFGFFSFAKDNLHRQSNETLNYHNISVTRIMEMYMQDRLSSAYMTRDNFLRDYDWILNIESFYKAGIHPADIYIPLNGFDHVYLVKEDGEIFYPQSHGKNYIDENIVINLHREAELYMLTEAFSMNDRNIALSYVVPFKNGIYLICTIEEASIEDVLDDMLVYQGEVCVLFSPDKKVMASSKSSIAVTGSTLKEYSEHFNFKENDLVVYNTNSSVRAEYAGRDYCLSMQYFKADPYMSILNFSLLSVAPERALYQHVLSSIVALAGICITICVIVIMFASVLITSFRGRANEMREMAYRDNLTSLYNMNYLAAVFKNPKRRLSGNVAFVALKIDNFRLLKDTYGYSDINKLIIAVGNTVAEQIGQKEIGIRVMEDKFCMVLECNDTTSFVDRLKSIRFKIYSACMENMDIPLNITISMGIYVYGSMENAKIAPEIAYDFADAARNFSKKNNDEKISFYNISLQQSAQRKKELEDMLEHAFSNKEFVPYLQPVVSNVTGKVVSAEALVRWIKPDGSTIFPDKFIPILEKNGDIARLDYYMFEKSCELLQSWRGTELENILISVNMSRQHFYQADFVQTLIRIVTQYSVNPSQLQIEITESIYIGDINLINSVVEKLRSFGFLISIDDFGTGYSSMSILQNVPINILKIDKQFIDSNLDVRKDNPVLKGIISMARGLGLKIICEGVETEAQNEGLKRLGCEFVQGYYYSRPLPIEDFETFAKERN